MNETTAEEPVIATVMPARNSPKGELRERVKNLRLGNGAGKSSGGAGMMNRIAWLPWILCGLLALSWMFVGVRAYRAAPKDDERRASGEPLKAGSANPISGPVQSGTIALEVKGYLMPARQIAVSPIDVSGKLIKLNFVEGKLYDPGFVLAEIDSTPYIAAKKEAEATFQSAESRLAAAEARLDDLDPKNLLPEEKQQIQQEYNEAQANVRRTEDEYKRLKSGSSAAIAARELQQAQSDYEAALARSLKLKATLDLLLQFPRATKLNITKADLQAAKRDKEAAAQRLVQAEWRLSNCTIKMPIRATVLTKKAELYNLVNPLAFGATSGSICDVADLSDLEVEVEIPERDIAKLKPGQPCRVKADAFPERTYEGKLDRIMPIANRAKSVVNVRVKVKLPEKEEPGTFLKPEMGAVVSFLAINEEKKN